MIPSHERLLVALRAALGADRVQSDPAALQRRALDTWPLPLLQAVVGQEAGPPALVVRPRSTTEVATALACLQTHDVPVVPYGGGSGVGGGAQPGPDSAVIDLGELDKILHLDEESLSVTVQSGVLLGGLEAYLNERGYITGHYPQSIDIAQVGGLVATRSSGQFSTKYGSIEDLVVGLEAVLPSGEIIRIKNVPRRAAGPDLRHLWIGSEGAFGVITEVTLKIFPPPVSRWMGAYAIPTVREGLAIIRQVMREGWQPAVVRLHDGIEAERSYSQYVQNRESILLLLSEGPAGYAELEGAALDRIVREAGGRPLGPAPVEAWLGHRNDVHQFEQFIKMGILVDTIEVAAPWTAIASIYEQVRERLVVEVPELLVVSGHSSHSYAQGTNLYFILAAQPPADPAAVARVYWSIWSRVMAITLEQGGTICHHHGIGKLRAPWLPAELGTSYPLLQALKTALDPRNLMNPGTLLPEAGVVPPRS